MPAQLLRKITKRTLLGVNVFLNFVFIASVGLVSIAKPISWLTGFAGLAIPYLILLQILFLLFWLFAKPGFVVFSFIALLMGWKQLYVLVAFQSTRSFVEEKPASIIRVANWNIRGFNGIGNTTRGMAVLKKQIVDAIQQHTPDIICLQEFNQSREANHIALFTPEYPYYYFAPDYQNKSGTYTSGCIIFSKWPIIQTRRLPYPDAESLLFADILHGKDTIRIYTTHLRSFKFKKEDYRDLDKIGAPEEEAMEASINIFRKMRLAFRYRERQALLVAKEIESCPLPLVLCADFNDVPTSYTYHQITGAGLQDAFIKASAGLGRTYMSLSPTLRIDFILPNLQWQVHQFSIIDEALSDHFLLLSDLELKK